METIELELREIRVEGGQREVEVVKHGKLGGLELSVGLNSHVRMVS